MNSFIFTILSSSKLQNDSIGVHVPEMEEEFSALTKNIFAIESLHFVH